MPEGGGEKKQHVKFRIANQRLEHQSLLATFEDPIFAFRWFLAIGHPPDVNSLTTGRHQQAFKWPKCPQRKASS